MMEPLAQNDSPHSFFDSDDSFDGSKLEKEFPYYDDLLSVSRVCHVQTAENRVSSWRKKALLEYSPNNTGLRSSFKLSAIFITNH